jgi:hypothetical protein
MRLASKPLKNKPLSIHNNYLSWFVDFLYARALVNDNQMISELRLDWTDNFA